MEIPNKTRNRFYFKKNNVKIFLFFLTFTSVLWLFVQFSKKYTQEVEVVVQYTKLPKDRILNEDSDQILKLRLTGNGFSLINYNWGKPKVKFDIADAVQYADNQYYFYIDKESSSLKKKLNFKGRILSVYKDTLKFKLDINLEKKVPVRIVNDIKYTPGYGSGKGLICSPDSVVIRGSEKVVNTINYVSTQNLILEELNADYKAALDINAEELPPTISIIPETVDVYIGVSKFTEGSQEIPVTLLNVPEGEDIKIFPKEVTVVYRVGLDKYKEISARDFKLVADYGKVAEESSFLILELTDKPAFIHDVRLQDKQVQFIILN